MHRKNRPRSLHQNWFAQQKRADGNSQGFQGGLNIQQPASLRLFDQNFVITNFFTLGDLLHAAEKDDRARFRSSYATIRDKSDNLVSEYRVAQHEGKRGTWQPSSPLGSIKRLERARMILRNSTTHSGLHLCLQWSVSFSVLSCVSGGSQGWCLPHGWCEWTRPATDDFFSSFFFFLWLTRSNESYSWSWSSNPT